MERQLRIKAYQAIREGELSSAAEATTAQIFAGAMATAIDLLPMNREPSTRELELVLTLPPVHG